MTEFAAMTNLETVQGAIAEAGLMAAMERRSDKVGLCVFLAFKHGYVCG